MWKHSSCRYYNQHLTSFSFNYVSVNLMRCMNVNRLWYIQVPLILATTFAASLTFSFPPTTICPDNN